MSEPQGLVRLKGLGKFEKKKIVNLIGSRTRDFPACSVVPQRSHMPQSHYSHL
jgi:hypothetical protein